MIDTCYYLYQCNINCVLQKKKHQFAKHIFSYIAEVSCYLPHTCIG